MPQPTYSGSAGKFIRVKVAQYLVEQFWWKFARWIESHICLDVVPMTAIPVSGGGGADGRQAN